MGMTQPGVQIKRCWYENLDDTMSSKKHYETPVQGYKQVQKIS